MLHGSFAAVVARTSRASEMVHSRPGRADSRSSHVRSAPKAEVPRALAAPRGPRRQTEFRTLRISSSVRLAVKFPPKDGFQRRQHALDGFPYGASAVAAGRT